MHLGRFLLDSAHSFTARGPANSRACGSQTNGARRSPHRGAHFCSSDHRHAGPGCEPLSASTTLARQRRFFTLADGAHPLVASSLTMRAIASTPRTVAWEVEIGVSRALGDKRHGPVAPLRTPRTRDPRAFSATVVKSRGIG